MTETQTEKAVMRELHRQIAGFEARLKATDEYPDYLVDRAFNEYGQNRGDEQ